MESRKKQKTKQLSITSSWPLYKLITYVTYFHLITGNSKKKLPVQRTRGKCLINLYLLSGGTAVLIVVLIIIAITVLKTKSAWRRKALEEILERYYQSKQALLRYVMLNRQCSEEAAYQRIAKFVKQHVPPDDYSRVDRMLAYGRQYLLDNACNLIAHDPDAIDKI